MRLNDRAKSLLSFHLPVVDFRVLLGSPSKKYTGSSTTYQLQTGHIGLLTLVPGPISMFLVVTLL